jgi:hypothetical protein
MVYHMDKKKDCKTVASVPFMKKAVEKYPSSAIGLRTQILGTTGKGASWY